ncbi:MAG: MotA/TolQ/ExbB proton channel family protein [Methylococcaceae bacterium]|nr:MotA/TolQ/ExbB proton channel family protein [Methylococcaceae bacterium]MCI0732435.1 MotA/TolQ/ExbB proton channel family protein [Methylococcaceae bacterium]
MTRWFMIGLLIAVSGTVSAAHLDLDKLLLEVKTDHSREARINQEREARFLAEKNSQAQMLSDSRAALAEQQARGDALKARFEENEAALAAMDSHLKGRSGELGELFGIVRQVAGDTKALLDASLITAQFPARAEKLEAIAKSRELPTVEQLETLWYLLQQEMTEQGKVVRFHGTVISASGESREADIVRAGPFNLFADGLYIRYLPETGEMVEFVRQPEGRYLDLAESLAETESGLADIGIDPTAGALLNLLVQAPDVWERIDQGGLIGYITLILGAVGLIIVAVRMAGLIKVGRRVQDQLKNLDHINADNPLGRVIGVARTATITDIESYELMIDEAVSKEIPGLEKGQSLIKLIAAVAPLLGLLGTVTGMIETFQVISLFGTGDPKLMAGGISEALVTTMLGLMVAIPLLFLHSLLVSRSRELVQILDEQSSGLICESLEVRKN